jgi:hypothetical protein
MDLVCFNDLAVSFFFFVFYFYFLLQKVMNNDETSTFKWVVYFRLFNTHSHYILVYTLKNSILKLRVI